MTHEFKQLNIEDLKKILGLTIKKDETNKVTTFLCQLSAFTENAQFNISYNAPSSTGKSYIPTEIAKLFPQDDLIAIGYCSPTAFFHDIGEIDKRRKGQIIVDLSRRILIFLDQPHTQLLERLRPLFSHDKKEIHIKITDKSQRQGLRTKNVILRGFPAVVFCTAGLKVDEQESTRFLLLSPETNQEKIREGINEKIKKETDNESYFDGLDKNPERRLLKERILAIRNAMIKEIQIGMPEKVREMFFKRLNIPKPRHQRDIGRLISLIKSIALLNLWFRDREGDTIIANGEDIKSAFQIWDEIYISQEMNLPPFVYALYQEIILPAWEKKGKKMGLTRQEIIETHYQVHGRMLDPEQLRKQILPMLDVSGLIVQESDPDNRRKMLVYPTLKTPMLAGGYRGNGSGVGDEKTDMFDSTPGN